jgi:hypothetical protein
MRIGTAFGIGCVLLVMAMASGCGGSQGGDAVIDPGDGGDYAPEIDPARFTDVIDNPFLPLLRGARWVYEARDGDEVERIEVTVTDDRRLVMGVSTVVVHDVVSVDGEVIEDTYDWFAQDDVGNVWYFGEATVAYIDGRASGAGSWEAGVDGARPGIVMAAHPEVGMAYRQEYLAGEAEDMGQVVALDGTAETPFGSFSDLVVTIDWTPLEPDVVERKRYATGVGFVYESIDSGGGGIEALVEFTPGEA